MQIFVKLQGGRTRTLSYSDGIEVSLLKKHIEAFEGIPCHEQRLACSQRELLDDSVLSGDDLLFISLSLRVVGGKGGFGSLLRGAPSKIGQKKTDNFDACRDLTGRRMRHTNNEKKIQEWIAGEKEREMEKVALQHIKKVANTHKFDDEKYTTESDSIKDSISGALERGIDEAKKTSVLVTSKKRSLESDLDNADGPLKRRQVWDDLDFLDEESEPETKEKKTTKAKAEATPARSPSTTTATATITTTTTTTTTSTSTSTSTPTQTASTATATITESISIEITPASADSPSLTPSTTSAISSTPSLPDIPVHKPIDVSSFASAKDLEALGGDVLKAELQRLGLLCGGTVTDRANRLFLLKLTPIGRLEKKYFAKKGRN